MSKGGNGAVLCNVRTLFSVGAVGGLTDGQLLERFGARRGEAAELAFATLVQRHGPMVLRVCRGLLRDPNDVDDAFQATFLVLVRKRAGSLWVRDSIGPWLYGVACRVATRALSDSARRHRHEHRAAVLAACAGEAEGCDDLGPLLHEEVGRLPERYRVPVVLCYLEGLTHEQAARQLGWPLGTVRSRLARGRDRLRGRLERRGAAPSAGMLALRLAQEGPIVPRALVDATVQAVTAGPAVTVAALARAVLSAMVLNTLMRLAAAVLIVGLGIAGACEVAQRAPGGSAPAQAARSRGRAVAATAAVVKPQSEAERIAERILKTGSDLFDAKQADALAASYTDDGEIHLVSKTEGRHEDSVTRGRPEVAQYYANLFKNAGTIDSENTVEFAQFVAPDLLIIHGRFRPDVGEEPIPFIQMRVKQGDEWLMSKLWLFVTFKKK